MKKRTLTKVIITFIFTFNFFSFQVQSQNKSDCFNWENFDSYYLPDSLLVKNIHFKQKHFYDMSINCKVPDFKVVTLNGDTLELSKLKDKIVILSFWFIECHPCIAEIPDINKLVEMYKSKDVVIISMSTDSKDELLKNFIPKHTLNSIIVPSCNRIANDYCVAGYPSIFIINKKGKLVKALMGNGRVTENDTRNFFEIMTTYIDGLL